MQLDSSPPMRTDAEFGVAYYFYLLILVIFFFFLSDFYGSFKLKRKAQG